MSSLISRSLVLGTATLLNQAVLLVSPMLLVRLLPIAEYGRYRQFVVAGSFLAVLAGFAINSNINYFVARSRTQAAEIITNTCLLLLATAALAAMAVIIARPILVPHEIERYWWLLLLYVFLYVNMDVFTPYALARGRSDQVLMYGVSLMIVRVGTIVTTAALFRDVGKIFTAMVAVEFLKVSGLFIWLRRSGLLTFRLHRSMLTEQLRFILPFGSSQLLYNLNENAGKLLVSSILGPTQLAIFTVASYQVPILTVVKSSLSDVIFPDMVQRSAANPRLGFDLWKRTQVLLFLFVCPSWLLMTYFAEPLIRVLFTSTYVSAAPYFQVLLLMMVRQCFDFSTPLRSLGNTTPALISNIIALICNLAVAVSLLSSIGLWAPTLAFVVSQIAVVIYLAHRLKQAYELTFKTLLEWQRLFRVAAASLLALGVLHLIVATLGLTLAAVVLGLVAYGVTFLSVLKMWRLDELDYLTNAMIATLRRAQMSRRPKVN